MAGREHANPPPRTGLALNAHTAIDLDPEYLLQPSSPANRHVPRRRRPDRLARGQHPLPRTCPSSGRRHRRPQPAVRGEDAVVTRQMLARRRHQRREARHQVE